MKSRANVTELVIGQRPESRDSLAALWLGVSRQETSKLVTRSLIGCFDSGAKFNIIPSPLPSFFSGKGQEMIHSYVQAINILTRTVNYVKE